MADNKEEKIVDVVIRVSQETRTKLKIESSKKQMTIKDYVALLVNEDIKKDA